MNIHGGVSARCFITPSLRAPVACSVSASVLRLILFFFSALASWSGSRRVNQYATPHRALLIFHSSLTHANIFAGPSTRISFPIHAASHDDNDPRADRYNDETDRNRLELSLSVSILTLHIDRRDRLIKYGDKSISVDSDGVNPMHDRQARLWNMQLWDSLIF